MCEKRDLGAFQRFEEISLSKSEDVSISFNQAYYITIAADSKQPTQESTSATTPPSLPPRSVVSYFS